MPELVHRVISPRNALNIRPTGKDFLMYIGETRRTVHERLNELSHLDGIRAFSDELITPLNGIEPKALKTALLFTVPIPNPWHPLFRLPIASISVYFHRKIAPR